MTGVGDGVGPAPQSVPTAEHADARTAAEVRWYALSSQEVASRLSVDPSRGLSADDAKARLAKYGANALPVEKPPSDLKRFLGEYTSFLQIILLVAAAVSFATQQLPMGILLVVLTLVNAVIGMVEEGKAASAMNALQKMVSEQVRVRRDGDVVKVGPEDLVPGDLVLLAAGDRIPADGRVVVADSLRADEAALTGESTPSGKQVEAPKDAAGETPLATADQHDMVFLNTDVTSGSGQMIVTGTGVNTAVGAVAKLLKTTGSLETPLDKQLNTMTVWIAIGALATMVIMFGAGLVRGVPFDSLFDTAIALALAAVPEALPTVVTVILSLGSVALAARQAVVKNLSSVETLGEVSAINSDKTGTLTMNQMTVTVLGSAAERYRVTGTGYGVEGKVLRTSGTGARLDAMVTPFILANDAQLKDEGVVGDPLDGALLVLAHKAGIDCQATRAAHERVATLPFDPSYKLMATFNEATDSDGRPVIRCSVKGAPEAILPRCTTMITETGSAPFDDATQAKADAAVTQMEGQGLRVLAAARKNLDPESFDPHGELLDLLKDMELAAIAGMIDPPRDSSKAAVETAQKAHIQVRMVTGDDVITGAAVAKQLGIPGKAITGQDLAVMSDAQAMKAIDDIGVIGRVAPADKQRLVDIMQKKGYVVASTGDGVNDAPALKAADIGVAMGSGTDVAKNSGRMILEDDNFATIIYAVEQGRKLYDNLTKYVRFILITLVTFVLTFLVATLLNIASGQPFTAAEILWINFLIDTPLGVALGFDSETPGLMSRRPLPRGASIITRPMMITVALVSMVMAAGVLGLIRLGQVWSGSVATGTAMALTAFGFFRIVCAWETRSPVASALRVSTFNNKQLNILIIVVIVVMVLATQWDLLNQLLGTTRLSGEQWAVCFGAGVVLLILWEIGKAISRAGGSEADQVAPKEQLRA